MKRDPKEGRAEVLIGITYQRAGNFGPALPHFEQAVRLRPTDMIARRYLGECLFSLGELERARLEFEAWVDEAPAEPIAHYSVGLVDLEEARLEEAESRFRRAIDLFEAMRQASPEAYAVRSAARARCHARLADVHFARDDYERARDELLASTRIEPRNISAYFTLSVVYRRLGDHGRADEALETYEAARQAIIEQRGDG